MAIGELKENEMKKLTKQELDDLRQEMGILSSLRHENIVEFIGICSSPPHLCIVTELAKHGDLYQFMSRTNRPDFQKQVCNA